MPKMWWLLPKGRVFVVPTIRLELAKFWCFCFWEVVAYVSTCSPWIPVKCC